MSTQADIGEVIGKRIERQILRRLGIMQAVQCLRVNNPGSALTLLEDVLADYEKEDREAAADFDRFSSQRATAEAIAKWETEVKANKIP
jgi:hypothetical protein